MSSTIVFGGAKKPSSCSDRFGLFAIRSVYITTDSALGNRQTVRDIFDNHALSYHESSPDLASPGYEFDLSISNRLPLFSGVVTNEVSFVVNPLSKGESLSVNSRTSNCFSKSSETRNPWFPVKFPS